MHPSISKRIKLDQPLNSSDCAETTTLSAELLPQEIVTYIGRFIVKSPALHFFSLASHKLAECASKAFSDFAKEGGALSFYSSNPDRAVNFAKPYRLSKLNLSGLKTAKTHLDALLEASSLVTKLRTSSASWTEKSHCALAKLVSLSITNYNSREVITLGDHRPWVNLTRFEFSASPSARYKPDIPELAEMPKLKKLELRHVKLPTTLPLQLKRLSDLKILSLINCEDKDNDANEATLEPYLQFAKACSELTGLSLTRESLTAWNFCRILPELTNLQVLRLERSEELATIEDLDGELRILNCVRQLTQLTTLSLIEFEFDEQIIEALSLVTGLKDLTLSIPGSGLDTESKFNKEPRKTELFTNIEALTAPESLDLSRQNLGFAHFQSLARLTNLRSLSLRYQDNIRPDQTSVLTRLTQLTSVDLRDSLDEDKQQAFVALLNMPRLSKLKLSLKDAVSALSKQHTPHLSTLILKESITDSNFDEAKVVETLTTLPEIENLYIDGLYECFSSTVLIAEKLTRLQQLAIYDLFDDELKQKIRRLLKSKKIRFIDDDQLKSGL